MFDILIGHRVADLISQRVNKAIMRDVEYINKQGVKVTQQTKEVQHEESIIPVPTHNTGN